MQNIIRTWREKVESLQREVQEAKNTFNTVNSGGHDGLKVWAAAAGSEQMQKVAGYEGLQLRKEIMEVLDEKGRNLEDDELIEICDIYNASLFILPEYEVYNKVTWELEITEDYKEHKINYEKFGFWEDKAYELKKARKANQKIETPVMASVIDTAEEGEKEEKNEDTTEVAEEPKQKPKKLSKTAKLKIQRERRKIKREEAREKEIRKLEREIKKIKAEEERLRKLRERKEKKLAQLLNKGKSNDSDDSNGSEGTGEKGGREEGGEREIQRADIAENLREEWRELKRELTKEAYFLLNKCGFTNKISRIDWKVKGVVGKPEGVVKKAKKYIERIGRFERKIQDSQKFAEWAPAWLNRKHRKIWKLRKAAEEWLKG